jgi:hypothetical protein
MEAENIQWNIRLKGTNVCLEFWPPSHILVHFKSFSLHFQVNSNSLTPTFRSTPKTCTHSLRSTPMVIPQKILIWWIRIKTTQTTFQKTTRITFSYGAWLECKSDIRLTHNVWHWNISNHFSRNNSDYFCKYTSYHLCLDKC